MSAIVDSVTDTVNSRPEPGSTVATHEVIAERLRARREADKIDLSKMDTCEIKSLSLFVYVGPMGYKTHKAWMDTKRFEETLHAKANKSEDDPIDRTQSDTYLLANSVYLENGQPLGMDLAKQLVELREGGPDMFQLLSLAEKNNPPREYMAYEVAKLLTKSSIDLLMWRIVIEAGLSRVLIDYMSTHSTEEEREWATEQLLKVEEVAYALQPLYNAEEAAKLMGISFNKAMTLVAEYGTADEYLAQKEQERSMQESLPGDEPA